MRDLWKRGLIIAFVGVLSLGLTVAAAAQDANQEKAERPPVYDEAADANAQIAAALERAKKDNKRVLVQWGANWCGWCVKLHDLFKSDREISKLLLNEYEVVYIDVGRFDKHIDVAEKYGAKFRGIPHLTVLDGSADIIANLNTGILEKDAGHDPAKVKGFLELTKAKALVAEDVYKKALAQAKKEDKKVFLHIGAPWCGWCKRLEAFIARPEIEEIINKYYVHVKIDQDRMTGGKEFADKIREGKQGGIPWFVYLDAEGKALVTSDGPDGNVGFPMMNAEIDYFMSMFEKTAQQIKPAELETIKTTLLTIKKELKIEG
jgi:thiol-disulfide isomerase/thioredoxin